MEETFNIYFAGETLAGHDPGEVRRKLAALFKADAATVDKLFSGETRLLRRNCSREQALKYQAAMERAGARPRITRSSDRGAEPALSLAPAGSDVLRPEERASVAPAEVDTSALSLAPPGEALAPAAGPAPAPPDTSHLSTAPVGEELPGLPRAAPPPAPDTSSLSLAEPGAGLAPPAHAAAAVEAPDLSIAAAGADLLDAEHRRREPPPAPSTDHLELEP
jgi:hypothetical protein